MNNIHSSTFAEFYFWMQWDTDGNFSVGSGDVIGQDSFLMLIDSSYNELSSYINTLSLIATEGDTVSVVIMLRKYRLSN